MEGPFMNSPVEHVKVIKAVIAITRLISLKALGIVITNFYVTKKISKLRETSLFNLSAN